MHRYMVPLALLAVVLVGCESESVKEEPVIEEPPPPSPQEIAEQVIQANGLRNPIPAPGFELPPGAGEAFLGRLRSAYAQHSATPEGREAMKIVSRAIEDRLRGMEQAGHWESVLVLCDAYESFNPGSTKYNRMRENATVQLRKPRITKLNFFQDGPRAQAWMDVYLPLEKKTYLEKRFVGEQFLGLELVEIIGNLQGVRLKYLETGETFDVMRGNL